MGQKQELLKSKKIEEQSDTVFKVTYIMKRDDKKDSIKSLFKHRCFTIPKEIHKQLKSHKIDYEGSYEVCVSEYVKNQYDNEIQDILSNIDHKAKIRIEISNPKKKNFLGVKRYNQVRCWIDYILLHAIKRLFISTLAFAGTENQIPEIESIEFSFDSHNKQVTISSLKLYLPYDNPYFLYARNILSLSIESIGAGNFKPQKGSERRNFYKQEQMSMWKNADKIDQEQAILGLSGIYMLYNSKENTFYLGKSENLLNRIKQHSDNPKEPYFGFTHYRYSVIQSEYYEILDLIENAAIHDIAWILDMPKADTYKPSLSTIAALDKCKMVNQRERQTRKKNK